jgi:uncharacterized membrane protein
MKNILEFFKTTILGGLFVLLPVILIYLALAETFEILVLIASPIADLFFHAIKSLTKGFASSQEESTFKPALLVSSDGEKKFVYIVEELDNDNLAILVPWTPTPFAGSIKIVSKDRVEPLSVSMGKLTEVLSQWGVGSREILAEKSETEK